jgi:adenine-specific DNA-methyltransferase
MEKLEPEIDGSTTDIVGKNIEELKELFPDVFTESSEEEGPRWKVDFNALCETLRDYAEDTQERYSFTWNGKARAAHVPDVDVVVL